MLFSMAVQKRTTRFLPGRSGACEARLFQFKGRPRDEEVPVERVAAVELEEALAHMKKWHPDFEIMQVELLFTVEMISGSPLN